MKALFIGNKRAYAAFQESIRPEWDWQHEVTSLEAYYKDNDIDPNTQIVMISDEFYNRAISKDPSRPNKKLLIAFLDVIYSCSQSALVIVVNYYPNLRKRLSSDLMAYAAAKKKPMGQYYWAAYNKINPSIDEAIKKYVNSDDSDEEVVREIAKSEHFNIPEKESVEDDMVEDDAFVFDDEPKTEYTNNFKKNGLVWCFTSSKGGVGKTSTSLAVGMWLALSSAASADAGKLKAPLKVCVVDLDVADGQISTVIKETSKTNVMKIVSAPVMNAETVKDALVYRPRMGCWFLLAPRMPKASYTISKDKYGQIIDILKTMFDVVILDTSVNYTQELFSDCVYPKSDKIIFITTMDRKAVLGLGKWIVTNGNPKSSDGAQIPLDKVKVAINQGRQGVELKTSEVSDIIRISTNMVYKKLDRTIPTDEWKMPEIVGAIPEIDNGAITKWSNLGRFEMTLNIPSYEKYVAFLIKHIIPKPLADVLDNITRVE
jgi:MinD-like ATPase involved in chromosome partitioning or flagellar assembly